MEGIFQTLPYDDQQKVEFACYRLRRPTWDWWQRIQANRTQQERTWGHFVVVFRAEYVSQRVVEKQEEDFLNFQQVNRIVHRYTACLERLFKRYRQLMDVKGNRTQQMVREPK
jgi:hypothetical protein